MRFIDLFAGLGGFHLALRNLDHTCVFASESDVALRDLYRRNFGLEPAGDIRDIRPADIPQHAILCAGFPCQPFSKAGSQRGISEPDSGGLFFDTLRIIQHHKPQYVLLENVPNFEKRRNGRTWERLGGLLRSEGYAVDEKKLSPHQFGVPQIRERVYIVGRLGSLDGFEWPAFLLPGTQTSIRTVLEPNPPDARHIPDQVKRCIRVWQDFLDRFPSEAKLPSFPIWSMEFGATYPYERCTPSSLPVAELKTYRGSHGCTLVGTEMEELLQCLPSHARTADTRFPDWKIQFIRQNRELYQRHKRWIDKWMPDITTFPSSFQKLEWNCQGEPRELERFVIQIRASGVRVKRPTTAPSLVAMTPTQVPIIGWEKRYMTPRECRRLQSMDELAHLPDSPTKAYKALGNAVNVRVAELVARALLGPAIWSQAGVDNPGVSFGQAATSTDSDTASRGDGQVLMTRT